MKAMILAAGKGTRVQPITHIIPKPMIPILQKPVMEFLLELLKEHGFKEIMVNVSHLAEEIENYMTEGTESTHGKAAGIAKKICSIDPQDYGCKLLYGHLCNLTKNRATAKEYIKPSLIYIDSIPDKKFIFEKMTFSQQHYLKFALMEMAKYQKNKNIIKAQTTLEMGKSLFYVKRDDCKLEDNGDFIALYDEVFN